MANESAPSKSAPRASIERGQGRSGRYLAISLLVTFCGVALVNYVVAGYLNRKTTNFGAFLIHRKWELLGEQEKPVDVLVLGDSTCNQGINTEILSREFGVSALNLCTTGSSALVGDLWMLEEYLARVGVPKYVVIAHAYDVWARNLSSAIWANVPRPTLPLTQSSIALGWDRIFRAMLLQNVPLYSQDVTLKRLLLASEDSQPRPEKPLLVDDTGFYREPKAVPRDVRADLAGWERHKLNANISKDNKQAIAQVARLADEHGFRVTYLNGPFFEGAHKKPKLAKFVGQQIQAVKEHIGKYPNLKYCGNRFLYPETQMCNVDHVNLAASEDYTRRLAPMVLGRPEAGCE